MPGASPQSILEIILDVQTRTDAPDRLHAKGA